MNSKKASTFSVLQLSKFAGPVLAVILAQQVIAANPLQPLQFVQVAARKAGTYWGIDVDVQMIEPAVPSDKFIAAPVALTVYQASPNSVFIEAGPIKHCQAPWDCKFRPYSAREKLGGDYDLTIDPTRLLSSGGNYGYKIDKIGTNQFEAIFCSGGGCGSLRVEDMGRDDFPYLFVAGESSGPRWLPIKIAAAKSKDANSADWNHWCYDIVNISDPDGEITPCNNFGWEIRFDYRVFLPLVLK